MTWQVLARCTPPMALAQHTRQVLTPRTTWLVLARCIRPLAHMSRSRHALTRCTPLLALALRTQLAQRTQLVLTQRMDVLNQGCWRRDDGPRAMYSTTGAGATYPTGAGAAYETAGTGAMYSTTGTGAAYTAGAGAMYYLASAVAMYSTTGAGAALLTGAGATYAITSAGGIHSATGAGVAYTADAVVTHDATSVGVMNSTTGDGTSITASAGAMAQRTRHHLRSSSFASSNDRLEACVARTPVTLECVLTRTYETTRRGRLAIVDVLAKCVSPCQLLFVPDTPSHQRDCTDPCKDPCRRKRS